MKLVVDFGSDTDKKKLWEVLKTRKPVKHVVEVKIAKEKRSNIQNSYYWVVVGIISEYIGYLPDEIHQLLKDKFLGRNQNVIKKTGEVFYVLKSTTALDTSEFSNYIEQIRLWALQDLDCYCPTPDEYREHQIELNTKYLIC